MLAIGLLSTSISMAQETVAVGRVLNKADKSPVSSVNVIFKNTSILVQSNEDGYFMIRTSGKETTLVFSSIGYNTREIKLKQGKSVGLEVELSESNNFLQEVFVIPGTNAALKMLKRVRMMKRVNNVSRQSGYKAQSTEQNLVLLSKIKQRSVNKRLFDQLKTGDLSAADSSLVLPLYMTESKYQLTSTKKILLSNNVFSSPENGEKILAKLVGEINTNLNFYNNTVVVFGKSLISPLSNVGTAYYTYYLSDSLLAATGKQYEIHFQTKNPKNLAFDGRLWIDSTTLAITRIEVELPTEANINFINNLRIAQRFEQLPNKRWSRESEELALNMSYALMADSLNPRPEILVKRSSIYNSTASKFKKPGKFAKSEYNQEMLDEKLKTLNNTPLIRTAKYIADIAFTGYIPVGKIDVGKIQQFARLTDIEGLRGNLPLRTNERLWKNITVGGYVGYGFRNKEVKYSGMAQYRLHGKKRRIFDANYTNDYRRISYNYNNFLYLENPLMTADEDITSTLVAFLTSANKMSERKEMSLSFANEWNPDIESNLYLRSNELLANYALPMKIGDLSLTSLQQQSVTLSTRFSFNERSYEDHLQRIYITNYKPVIYGTLEIGKYRLGNKTGNYGKLLGTLKQRVRLDMGQWNYLIEAGRLLGTVPYPLLNFPEGSQIASYSLYKFNLMNHMEYATDKFIHLHTDFTLNGILLNQIPLIKHLNLREFASFNMAYGTLSDAHRRLLDYPEFMQAMKKPYMEVGVGLTNILHILSVQSVWRLTDNDKPGVERWEILTSIGFSF